MLAQAIEAEVAQWMETHPQRDEQGHRQVVRNGFMPQRKIVTGLGEIAVQQPRVHDRRPPQEREHFTSKILPPYLRKTKAIEELIPWRYLKNPAQRDQHGRLPRGVASAAGSRLSGPLGHHDHSAQERLTDGDQTFTCVPRKAI